MKKIWKNYKDIYPNYNLEKRLGWIQFRKTQVIGITRIRNEELIILDTLKHLAEVVDKIIVLDDDSSDKTVEIVKKNPKVIEILRNTNWERNRIYEETHHRALLLERARLYDPEWIFYFDADERFELTKEQILGLPEEIDGVKIRLFDAYITQNDKQPYGNNQELYNFRKYFGPEYRDILMLFRNKDYISFEGLDSREPVGCKNLSNKFYCQHYGKSISIEQWEETCDYYAINFPEPYKTKWEERRGKAIHSLSDFNNPLYKWSDIKKHEKPL